MDDVFLHGTCMVCQAPVADEDTKEKHIAEKAHVNKFAVYSFMKEDVPQMEKSYDGTSILYSHCSKRSCSVLGMECIYEINYPWTSGSPIWVCTMCFVAGDSLESFNSHMDSNSHRELYLNDYGEDNGLAMPELYNGSTLKEIVCGKLKIGSDDVGVSVADPIAKSEESESDSAAVKKEAEESNNNNGTRYSEIAVNAQNSLIGGHFSLQRCGHSSSVNKTISVPKTGNKVTAKFEASKEISKKRPAEAEQSLESQHKKTRCSAEPAEAFDEDSMLMIDVSDDADEREEPKPKQEAVKTENAVRKDDAKAASGGIRTTEKKPAKSCPAPTPKAHPKVQYPTLPASTCVNSTRHSSNVLVLTSSQHHLVPVPVTGKAKNSKNSSDEIATATAPKVQAPISVDSKAKPANAANSKAKKKTAHKASSTAKNGKEEKPKLSHSTSAPKPSDRSSSRQGSSQPSGSRRRSRTRSPGYVRPSGPDSVRPRGSYYDSRRPSPPPPRGRPRSRSPSGHRSLPPAPLDEVRVQELKTRMYAHRRQLMQLHHRRDLVDYMWKQGIEPIRPDDSQAIFFNSAAAAIPDIVGVTHLYPVDCYDRPGFETLYCGMCQFWSTSSVMIEKHLVSYIHRMNYLSRNFTTFYKIVKDEHDKAMKEKLLEQYVKQIWRTEGSGMMTHRLKCVVSGAALDKLWPDYMKFKSDRWKAGVKVEIIHQAAQQEAYEQSKKREMDNALARQEQHEREKYRRRSRSRSRHRERSPRRSPERRRDDRDRRGQDYYYHERDRAMAERRRSRSPHRPPYHLDSRREMPPHPYDQHPSGSRDRFEEYRGPPPQPMDMLSEEDRQLRLICGQLGLSEADLPKARLIIRECSKHLTAQRSPERPPRAVSPTTERLSGLRNILNQAMALESHKQEPLQPQAQPPQHFPQFLHEPLPPMQQQQQLQPIPDPMPQRIPSPDLWQPPPAVQQSWNIPPPNLSVPPPAPVPPPFPVPQSQHVYGQPPPDTYGYQPPPGHHY